MADGCRFDFSPLAAVIRPSAREKKHIFSASLGEND